MQTQIDKSKELNASILLVNNKLKFAGSVEGNETLQIDYTAPLGDDEGYTSMELLLLSLSSCMGSVVLIFLRKMNKTISGLEINSKGYRRPEHPTGFETIIVDINLKSPDVSKADMDKVLILSEETYCPVWSMLKGNVSISVVYNITE
jgi:putative redox protein